VPVAAGAFAERFALRAHHVDDRVGIVDVVIRAGVGSATDERRDRFGAGVGPDRVGRVLGRVIGDTKAQIQRKLNQV
jgi:hypothetical protein